MQFSTIYSTESLAAINMKSFVAVCFLVVVGIALARPGEEKYTDKYDGVDLDEILSNRRLLVPYVHCALDKGKCTADGKELKDHIADALETECSKCTEAQKKGIERVIKHLINEEPEFWKELKNKYDPKDKYTKKYEKELKRIQS